MANATNYFENLVANVFRGSNITGVTAYAALYDGNPTETGTGATEVTTSIRVAGRIAVTFAAPSDGFIANTALIDFGPSAGAATVGGFALLDAPTGGNMLCYQGIAAINVLENDEVRFNIGNINITVS